MSVLLPPLGGIGGAVGWAYYSIICLAWSFVFTCFGSMMRSTRPSSSMTNVVRRVPKYFRPYIFLDELVVRLLVLHAHAEHLVAFRAQLVVVVAQVAGLCGASRGHVLRIEIEHELSSSVVAEPQLASLFVAPQHFWSHVTNVYHRNGLLVIIVPTSANLLKINCYPQFFGKRSCRKMTFCMLRGIRRPLSIPPKKAPSVPPRGDEYL